MSVSFIPQNQIYLVGLFFILFFFLIFMSSSYILGNESKEVLLLIHPTSLVKDTSVGPYVSLEFKNHLNHGKHVQLATDITKAVCARGTPSLSLRCESPIPLSMCLLS